MMMVRVAMLITTLSAAAMGHAQAAPAAEAQRQAAKQPADAHRDHAGQLQQLRHAVFAGPGHICDRQEQRPPQGLQQDKHRFYANHRGSSLASIVPRPSRHGDLHRHTAPGGSEA